LTDLESTALLAIAFFLIALLYSSVGHGGASAYLGALVLAGYSRPMLAPLVLTLNLVVTLLGWARFRSAGHFSFELLFPFIVTSIPAAFIGAKFQLSTPFFSTLLALALFCSGLRMFIVLTPVKPLELPPTKWLWKIGPTIGSALGLLAGMTGIGGGIFLSPILLLLGWADIKQTAAASAAFIAVNSLSGLSSQLLKGGGDWSLLLPLGIAVGLGGAIGSWSGALRLQPLVLQRLLGVVLLLAAVKLAHDLLV